MKTDLLTLGNDGLKSFVEGLGMPGYRAAQILNWVYARGVTDFSEMTNISKADRGILAANAEVIGLGLADRLVSSDGTEKYLFTLSDGAKVESVMIPEEDRVTLCVSSQAGCALGCRFCLTGAGGFVRDLVPHEITGQVYVAIKLARPRELTNLVFMGMGEPLLNTANLFEAIRRLTDPAMFAISTRRVTVSTSGVIPGIKALGDADLGVSLAVSVNATTDEARDVLMPINRKYPLKKLVLALKGFPLDSRRRITIEYVLLGGLNDTLEDARRLAVLLRGLRCKVNLIPYNAHAGSEYRAPSRRAVLAFQAMLQDYDYTAFIRDSRGGDILAACGQLAGGR